MAQTIVIFGASGDLTSRKLIPAIYSLAPEEAAATGHEDRGLLPDGVLARRLAPAPGGVDGPICRAAV